MHGCSFTKIMYDMYAHKLYCPLPSEKTTVKFVGAGKKYTRLCKCSWGSKKFASGENNEAGEAVGLTWNPMV